MEIKEKIKKLFITNNTDLRNNNKDNVRVVRVVRGLIFGCMYG